MAHNHYPLFGRTPPSSCDADPQDTANPFTPPTCPKCVARLELKVAAELAEAERCKGQERQLHLGTANMFRDVINGRHQVSA